MEPLAATARTKQGRSSRARAIDVDSWLPSKGGGKQCPPQWRPPSRNSCQQSPQTEASELADRSSRAMLLPSAMIQTKTRRRLWRGAQPVEEKRHRTRLPETVRTHRGRDDRYRWLSTTTKAAQRLTLPRTNLRVRYSTSRTQIHTKRPRQQARGFGTSLRDARKTSMRSPLR